MKLYIYVTDVKDAFKDDFNYSLTCSSNPSFECGSWILAGEVDFEFNIDKEVLRKHCIDEIEEEEKIAMAKLETLRQKKQEFMAITYQPPCYEEIPL